MSDSIYDLIAQDAQSLKLELTSESAASLALRKSWTDDQVKAVRTAFAFVREQKRQKAVATLLRLSRLPLKEPKTFENFDFGQLKGDHMDALKELPQLTPLYAHRNLAFIGPQGVGKTHLAMVLGRACCEAGYKAYFLKATQLNEKFRDALKQGKEKSTVNELVKPSCLIIDEVGRCVFDKTETRMFFDVIDRRYNKEGPNTTILTSNLEPSMWGEFFSEDSSLLCTLDRIFDTATVFLIKGESYRGKHCKTVTMTAGQPLSLPGSKTE